jgi:hypothetical protein
MADEKDAAGRLPSERLDSRPQPGLVAFAITARRRSLRALLAKGQIAPEHRPALCAKRIRDGDHERILAVRPRSVGKHQGVGGGIFRLVQESPDRYVIG